MSARAAVTRGAVTLLTAVKSLAEAGNGPCPVILFRSFTLASATLFPDWHRRKERGLHDLAARGNETADGPVEGRVLTRCCALMSMNHADLFPCEFQASFAGQVDRTDFFDIVQRYSARGVLDGRQPTGERNVEGNTWSPP